MNNEILHDDLDDFLKTKFENHSIIPNEELWEKISPRISTEMVSHTKYIRMRNAFVGTAVSLVGAVFLLLALNTNLFKTKNQNNTLLSKTPEIQNHSTEDLAKQELNIKTVKNKVVGHKTITLNSKSKDIDEKKDFKKLESTNSVLNTIPAIEEPNVLNEQKSSTEPTIAFANDSVKSQNTKFNQQLAVIDTSANILAIIPKTKIDKAKMNKCKPEKPILELPTIDLSEQNNHHLNPFSSSGEYQNKGTFSFSELLKRIEIGGSISPLLSTRTLSQSPNTENTTFDSQYYNNIEKSFITSSEGLDITFRANEDWSFITGVHASGYQHETQSDALHREVISPNELLLYTSAGKVPIYGSGMDQLPGQSVLNTKINLTFIEVPLIVRYYWFQNLFIDAGVDYSYLMSSKTTITAEEFSGSFTHSEIAGIQKHSFKAIAGIGLDFKINPRLKWEIGPELKWQINSMNVSEINVHPLYLGLRTGLRFKLN
ncbi:MAG: outer membrane beta-barrel protein [Paludibacter sp.]